MPPPPSTPGAARDGSARHERPDGHDTILNTSGDPRFGMQAPVPALLRDVQPSGLLRQLEEIRDPPTLNDDNPLSVSEAVTRYVVGSKTYTRTFTGATRTIVDMTPLNRTRTTTLDPLGRVASVAVGGLAPVTFTRDPVTHLITAITEGSGPTARTTTLGYDAKRRLTTITDSLPVPRTVTLGYDLADRVVSQTFPDGRIVQFEYDPSGNVTKVIPPGVPAHPHDFTYTPVELEQRYAPPDIGLPEHATQYTYNLDRQLTQILRPDGQTVSFTYEPTGGRLATRTAAGETVTFGYQPVTGQLVSLDSTGEQDLTLTHDGSLLTAVTLDGAVDGTAGTTYDHVFRVLGTTVSVPGSPATHPIAFGYDDDSLLTQAGALTLTRHDAHGLVRATTLTNVVDEREYNPFGEIAHYTATTGGAPALELTYTRDALGRIETVTEALLGGAPQTTTYDYDARGRLETVTPPTGPVVSYTYDDNGNRLARELDGVPVEAGTYDAQDRLLTYDGATYTYTANGELERKTIGTQTTLYDYDTLGNLRAVTRPDGTVLEYVIDPANRRVGKRINGVLTQGFVYEDQLRIAAELDGAGRVRSRFVYGTRIDVPEYMVTYDEAGAATGTFRLVTDHLGSPRLVIDVNTGSVAQRMDYDEFGRVFTDTNPGFQPFGFAGGLYDRDTGFVRFGARDYNSIVGRWTAKDPLRFDAGDGNLYAYALGDPLNLVDPDGGNPVVAGFFIGAISGTAWELAAQVYANGGLACLDVDWMGVGSAALKGAVAGALLGAAGPRGFLFGRQRLRPDGMSGIFNRCNRSALDGSGEVLRRKGETGLVFMVGPRGHQGTGTYRSSQVRRTHFGGENANR